MRLSFYKTISALSLFFFITTGKANIEVRTDPALRELVIQAINNSESFNDRYVAEVWLTDMSTRLHKRISDPEKRLNFLRLVHNEARRAQLPPELVLAVIDVESNFDRWAISRSGAQGLMQVMPFWLKEIGRPDDNLLHPETNLRLGCTILKYYMDKEKGDLRKALALYNGIIVKRKYPDKVFSVLRKRWFQQ